MCLYLQKDNLECKIAKKDIKCYKVVEISRNFANYKNLLKTGDKLKIDCPSSSRLKMGDEIIDCFININKPIILEFDIYVSCNYNKKSIYVCSNTIHPINEYDYDELVLSNSEKLNIKNKYNLDIDSYKYVFNFDFLSDFYYNHLYINNVNIYKTNPVYLTYYRCCEVDINTIYKSQLELIHSKYETDIFLNRGLHSFKYLKDSKSYTGKYICIATCIIPKGSSYYEGDFNGRKSYASDTLIYTNIKPTKPINLINNIIKN